MLPFILETPQAIQVKIGQSIQAIRLQLNMTRSTLALKSGVSSESIKRFENTGEVSLKSFVRISLVLGLAEKLQEFLTVPAPKTIEELEKQMASRTSARKRGRK
jgi:HTH-type transcriptional regulator / antitoxin HipB